MLIADAIYGAISNKSKTYQGSISQTTVLLIALLDSSVPFAFFLQTLPLDAWYALTIGLKFVICIYQRNKVYLGPISAISFYVISCIIVMSSIIGGSGLSDYIRIFAFIFSLFMTLSLIRRQNLSIYISTSTYVIGASTLLYIFMVYTGHFEGTWGRYNYFGDSHPNLGSEIIAMSVIYASCVLQPVQLIAFALPSIYAINLMEGRAGLIVCISAVVAGIFTQIESPRNRIALASLVGGLILISVTFYHDATFSYLNSILLLNDEHRGVDTGYVGRDELWGGAWDAFLQSPIIGNGAGFEDRLEVNPHNFFLFGLALFGFFSLFVFGAMIYLYYELYRYNIRLFCVLIITSIMFIFNDRFFNLNPYPFLLYVALFAHAQLDPDRSAMNGSTLARPLNP